jgi:signal peptidase I
MFKKAFVFLWEALKIVVVSLAIIIPIRYFLIQPFFVRGASMLPNFDNGEYLVINEIGYRFETPQRGQVIIFKYPLNPSQYYIKRIIGLPGETVEIKNGRVFIQGAVLDESDYLPEGRATSGNLKVELGQKEYFVLGDNRSASSDSRQWGILPRENIIGFVWIRAWPFDTFEVF